MKNLYQLLLIGLVALLAAPSVQAEQLTAEQSLARLTQSTAGTRRMQGLKTANLTLAYTASQAGNNLFYVFNRPSAGGFLILAADDLAPELLGYTESGAFDENHMAPGARYWLGTYERQIAQAIRTGEPMYSSARRSEKPAAVVPLLTTTWGQGDSDFGTEPHYYIYCPTKRGKRCPAGCVATAMAQIMNYHKWPVQGKGSHSYRSQDGSTMHSANFGETTYDWAAMQDHYGYTVHPDGSYTVEEFSEESNKAVSLLMYHCGVSVDMEYSTEGSGAMDNLVGPALVNYFDYDVAVHQADRLFYTDEQWEALLYDELAANRPILYCGATVQDEGHAFVCDGYADGYYHFNWGWDGMSDGYYLVTGDDPLHPKRQGTGGSFASNAFTQYQTAIIGIQRPQADSKPYVTVLAEGSYTVRDYESKKVGHVYNGSNAEMKFTSGVFNCSLGTISIAFGTKFVSEETGQAYYFGGDPTYYDVGRYQGAQVIYGTIRDLPDGLYRAYPAYMLWGEKEWRDALVETSVTAPLVACGDAELPDQPGGDLVADAKLFCSEVTARGGSNNNRMLGAAVKTPGNISSEAFDGWVTMALYDSEDQCVKVLTGSQVAFEMATNMYQPQSLNFNITIPDDVPNARYFAHPVALQTGSENWARFCYVDMNQGYVYDTVLPSLTFWLKDNTVSYTEIDLEPDGINGVLAPTASQPAYDLQGRPAYGDKGIRLSIGKKVMGR